MKFGLALPQGTLMEFAGIKEPVAAYELLTQVALGCPLAWRSDAKPL